MQVWHLDLMSSPVFFVLVISLGLFILLFIVTYYNSGRWERKAKKNLGRVIKKLEYGEIYHQVPFPDGLVFLLKEGETGPKAYVLEFDVNKIPVSFMCILGDNGTNIVDWKPFDPYEKKFNAIELMELAGREPE